MSDESIAVEIRPTPWLMRMLVIAHAAAAMVLVTALPLGWVLYCACSLLIASTVLLVLRGDPARAITRFELEADSNCRWQQAEQSVEGRLRGDTAALPWLIVLRIDEFGRRSVRSLILFPGSLHRDDWRRLQIFLRWGVRFSAAASIPSAGPY